MSEETFATPDLITYVVNYNKAVAGALAAECGINVTEYCMLAYLGDHVEAVKPATLAAIVGVSPAMITISADKLLELKAIRRTGAKRSPLQITKVGVDLVRDADIVVAQTYEEYFSVLPANLRAILDTGSVATNTSSAAGNRMREGHFFAAFEILHAFLTVEYYLTNVSQISGMSLGEFRILFELDAQGVPLGPNELGAALLLKPSTVSFALRRLEQHGFIVRLPDPGDRRRSLVWFTDEGRAAFGNAFVAIENVFTTDIRPSVRTERDAYKDIAAYVVASLRKRC